MMPVEQLPHMGGRSLYRPRKIRNTAMETLINKTLHRGSAFFISGHAGRLPQA